MNTIVTTQYVQLTLVYNYNMTNTNLTNNNFHHITLLIQTKTTTYLLLWPFLQDCLSELKPHQSAILDFHAAHFHAATVRPGLRSAASSSVAVPRTISSLGDRFFAAAGPRPWNKLPPPLRRVYSPDTFKRQLKTFLYNHAFNLHR